MKKLILLILSILLIPLFSSSKIEAINDEIPKRTSVSLFMTGDALIHNTVYEDAYINGTYDFHNMLQDIYQISDGYDLKYYNQETILGGTELVLSNYPMFNSPQEFGDTMIDYGFNLVSTATNHSMDRFEEGIISQYQYWKSHPEVIMDGTNMSFDEQNDIPIHEINGLKFAYFAYTYGTNGIPLPQGKEYLVNVYTGNEEQLLERVKKASSLVDFVICAMHWGTEYSMGINDEQLYLAQALADAGCNLIIGNHPHVIEPIKYFGDTLCYFALGNMISAQLDTENLTGMIGAVDIVKYEYKDHSEIKIENPRADLIYTYYSYGQRNFHVYLYDQLNDSILPNHQSYYQQYLEVVKQEFPDITIGNIGNEKNRKAININNDLWSHLLNSLNFFNQ